MKLNRHGDVELIAVASIPEGAELLKGRKELAYGETTGHAHRIDVGELFQTKSGELYLKVDELAKLSHEEHKTRTVEPGTYRVEIKRAYDPEGGWNPVVD